MLLVLAKMLLDLREVKGASDAREDNRGSSLASHSATNSHKTKVKNTF